MVIIDGKPASANTVLAVACVGKKIQTVESLGGDKPDPVPVAFLHNDAMQCGFCTPGFRRGGAGLSRTRTPRRPKSKFARDSTATSAAAAPMPT